MFVIRLLDPCSSTRGWHVIHVFLFHWIIYMKSRYNLCKGKEYSFWNFAGIAEGTSELLTFLGQIKSLLANFCFSRCEFGLGLNDSWFHKAHYDEIF